MRRASAAKLPRESAVLKIQGATDRGLVRSSNQDSFAFDEQAGIAIVADGMGGQAAGEVASQMAADTVLGELRLRLPDLERSWEQGDFQAVQSVLGSAVLLANRRIYERAEQEPDKRGMGTTLDVALVLYPDLFLAHVGDSRVFRVSGGGSELLTRDHSMAEALVESGTVTFEQASQYENVLLRSVGTRLDLEVDVLRYDLSAGDRIVLCSDGIWHYFRTSHSIATLVRKFSGDPATELVRESLKQGGEDNATAVVMSILK